MDNVRVIQTNGHHWKLFEFGISELKMRQTRWYQARTINELMKEGKNTYGILKSTNHNQRRIWNDYEMIEIVLGLVRYSTSFRNTGEEELREIYEHLNELHIMEEPDTEEKETLKKKSQRYKFLPKRLREFVVGYDTDGKKLD